MTRTRLRLVPPPQPEPLWREVLGARLRRRRHDRGQTLAEVADRAGISPQYLSEIERGRKEPSWRCSRPSPARWAATLIDLTGSLAARPAPPHAPDDRAYGSARPRRAPATARRWRA